MGHHDAILWHASADEAETRDLADVFAAAGLGIACLVDAQELRQPAVWVFVCVGEGGLTNALRQRTVAALKRSVVHAHMRVVGLQLTRADPHSDGFLGLDVHGTLDLRGGANTPRARLLLQRMVQRMQGQHDLVVDDEQDPWPGLAPYGLHNARALVARGSEVDDLLASLVLGERYLWITGSDGVGKTSIAIAGVAASLARGDLQALAGWRVAVMRPGEEPDRALAAAIAGLEGWEDGSQRSQLIRASLLEDPHSLRGLVDAALQDAPAEACLVLVVDEVEELLAQPWGREQEDALHVVWRALRHAVDHGRLRVVGTLHAAWVGDLRDVHGSARQRTWFVPQLSERALRRIIAEPALAAGGWVVEAQVLDELIRLARAHPRPLPLLQLILWRLWRARDPERRQLTWTRLMEQGGVLDGFTHALQNYAGSVLDEIIVADQRGRDEVLEDVMAVLLRFVVPGRGALDRCRSAARSELSTPGRLRIADALITAGLLVGDDDHVGLAHSVLLQEWPIVSQAMDVSRESGALLDDLSEAAERWRIAKLDPALRADYALWRGGRLLRAQEILTPEELSSDMAFFLEAAEHVELRRRRRSRLLLGTAAAGVWVASVALAVAVGQGGVNADLQRRGLVDDQLQRDELLLAGARAASRDGNWHATAAFLRQVRLLRDRPEFLGLGNRTLDRPLPSAVLAESIVLAWDVSGGRVVTMDGEDRVNVRPIDDVGNISASLEGVPDGYGPLVLRTLSSVTGPPRIHEPTGHVLHTGADSWVPGVANGRLWTRWAGRWRSWDLAAGGLPRVHSDYPLTDELGLSCVDTCVLSSPGGERIEVDVVRPLPVEPADGAVAWQDGAGVVHLWRQDLGTLSVPSEVEGLPADATVDLVVHSPDGLLALAAGPSGALGIWRWAPFERAVRLSDTWLRWSPASKGDKTCSWAVDDVAPLPGGGALVLSEHSELSFAPDESCNIRSLGSGYSRLRTDRRGTWLASGLERGTWLWRGDVEGARLAARSALGHDVWGGPSEDRFDLLADGVVEVASGQVWAPRSDRHISGRAGVLTLNDGQVSWFGSPQEATALGAAPSGVVALCGDDSLAAAADEDGNVRIWQTDNARLALSGAVDFELRSLRFSADCGRVLLGGAGTHVIWQLDSETVASELEEADVACPTAELWALYTGDSPALVQEALSACARSTTQP